MKYRNKSYEIWNFKKLIIKNLFLIKNQIMKNNSKILLKMKNF